MKEQIREIVLSYGADVCGFANTNRFNDAPSGFNPTDIYADCKSVISFGVALPKGLIKINPRLIYSHFTGIIWPEIDLIAFKAAKKIEEDFGCFAIPIPCEIPFEYWDNDKEEGRGLLSMKHTAVQAGLGSLGKNTLFMNKDYGNLLTLGAILTNLDLPSDKCSEDLCIENCHECIDNCPAGAIRKNNVDQKLCRENAFGETERGFKTTDCNKCRIVCPINDK